MQEFDPLEHARKTLAYWLLVLLGCAITAAGLGAAHFMEVRGHAITGMNNQIVWGLPHVFAIFMIVCASGVLNVASIGSVFGASIYKSRAKLSGLLAITLLAGGLMVLMLDLGRADRVIVAATHYNPTSVFAWNVLLYSGLAGLTAAYLWTLLERRMNPYAKSVGIAVLIWRFALTTGTGSIFAFLVARQAYQSAILAPLFIVLSFAWGLAVFLIVQSAMYAWNRVRISPAALQRMARLLALFVTAALYLAGVYHATNLYYAKQGAFEAFILAGAGDPSGVFAPLFWVGYVLLGSAAPMALLYPASKGNPRKAILAAALVIVGAFAFLYVFIIGGQAFPLDIFPGYDVSSSFGDGAAAQYTPRLPEWLLGAGGLGLAFLLTTIGVRALDVLPREEPWAGANRSEQSAQPPQESPPGPSHAGALENAAGKQAA